MPSIQVNGNAEDGVDDMDALFRELDKQGSRKAFHDHSTEFDIFRSGSAPPTVEGSISAITSSLGNLNMDENDDDLLTVEWVVSHPQYTTQHNNNLNPRLRPPPMSMEDRRVVQQYQPGASSFGGIGDWRMEKGDDDGRNMSFFSLQPAALVGDREGELEKLRMPAQEEKTKVSSRMTGLGAVGLGARTKSFADVLQEGLGQSIAMVKHSPSCPASHNASDNIAFSSSIADNPLAHPQNGLDTKRFHPELGSPGLAKVHNAPYSHASVLGSSHLRCATPDPCLIKRTRSHALPSVARTDNFSEAISSCMVNQDDRIAFALSGLSLSKTRLTDEGHHVEHHLHHELASQAECTFEMPNDINHYSLQNIINESNPEFPNIPSAPMLASRINGGSLTHNISKCSVNGQSHLPKGSFVSTSNSKLPPVLPPNAGGSRTLNDVIEHQGRGVSGNGTNGFLVDQRLPGVLNSKLDEGAIFGDGIGLYMNRNGRQSGFDIQKETPEPLYLQYLHGHDLTPQATLVLNDLSIGRNFLNVSNSNLNVTNDERAYLRAFLAAQSLNPGMLPLRKSVNLNHGYYENPAIGFGLPYSTRPFLPALASRNHARRTNCLPQYQSMGSYPMGGSLEPWIPESGIREASFGLSLLEEFKINKSRSFELLDIENHVVEFSVDQHGSRFIQQKLETASVEEKNKIFPEILPHTRALMVDVFGNYVIQKFFEHGTESQRMLLASQLTGHVLPLSLQMYGCRVIQKALEVVSVDQQTEMAIELDGSVLKCVYNQNGNHVIQKCIECIPHERIQFIISSFYGQIVSLSSHPYGCRVIQRVLEYCHDAKTKRIMMNEVLQSACALAQDQYGNYVVQHVLEHGEQVERSSIIRRLAGNIVEMSQQKFASNVVEKCLTFGSPEEHQLLINEILGCTDENEPLQAMMKDQFGNYVVQKVLETCDDANRDLILSRIRVHLNTLKKYTYGKHIVARVEKLVATGGEI